LGEPKWSQWVKGDRQDFTRLGHSGESRAVDLLIAASEENDIRIEVSQAIAESNAPRFIEPLIKMLSSDSFAHRQSAAIVLIKIAEINPSLIGQNWQEIAALVEQPHAVERFEPWDDWSRWCDIDRGIGLTFPKPPSGLNI
jgi:hypothetical protein